MNWKDQPKAMLGKTIVGAELESIRRIKVEMLAAGIGAARQVRADCGDAPDTLGARRACNEVIRRINDMIVALGGERQEEANG